MEVLEKKLNYQECYISRIDQYSKRNNIEIQNIPKTAKDEELESIYLVHLISVYPAKMYITVIL